MQKAYCTSCQSFSIKIVTGIKMIALLDKLNVASEMIADMIEPVWG